MCGSLVYIMYHHNSIRPDENEEHTSFICKRWDSSVFVVTGEQGT
jgi:hypothetical protein